MHISRFLSIALLTISMAACTTSPSPMPVAIDAPRLPRESAMPPPVALTQSIVIVADSQIHESRGTASRYWSLAGDEFVPVTIRTGQQTIGAADLLAEVLRREKRTPLVLHLGDAIDVSCETEWDLYAAAMTGARQEAGPNSWLLAPGNHDGYLVGNFFPLKGQLYNQGHWDEVCNTGRIYDKTRRYRMTKKGVLEAYRASLERSGAARPAKREGLDCTGSPVLFCSFTHVSLNAPWTSFIVQAVKLPAIKEGNGPPIFAILVDTSDYAAQPRPAIGALMAGVDAGISATQWQAAAQVIDALPGNARFFLAGHHPFSSWQVDRWSSALRADLQRVLAHPKSLRLIVTAHTHEGGWYQHKLAGGDLLELNTGSLIDSPSYYRHLQFEIDGANRMFVHSPQQSLVAALSRDCDFLVRPVTGSDYGIEDQESESDRQSSAGGFVRVVGASLSAINHFAQFWKAKHIELRPQLLTYADVVDYSMPVDATFVYRVPGTAPVRLDGRVAVSAKLRALARCMDKVRCPAREKETILYALERYYWFDTSVSERTKTLAHNYRTCAALWAGEASAKQNSAGRRLIEAIEARTVPARWMLPP